MPGIAGRFPFFKTGVNERVTSQLRVTGAAMQIAQTEINEVKVIKPVRHSQRGFAGL
jgi:hypothetical protein